MTFYEPSDPQALHAVPGDRDDPKGDRDNPIEDDQTWDGDPLPSSPPDLDHRDRAYTREIHGDERGGNIPKRPGAEH